MKHSPQRPLLQIEQLQVSISGQPLIHELTLSLAPGEILGLVGESGSGKSLTALSILGLLPRGAQATGRILLDGRDLLAQNEAALNAMRGRDIGMVFQEPMTALNPLINIGDQVAEVLRVHRATSWRAARLRAQELLERVGLPAAAFGLDRYPHQLSGGQRQRVAIAMAIALQPKLLIADEPTTALDVTTQAQILALLQRLVREEGCALLLVTHDLAVVAERADQVAVLRDGRLVEQGQAELVLARPEQPYTASLLSHSRVQRLRGLLEAEPGQEGTPLLEVRELVREYRHGGGLFKPASVFRAVDQVSLTVQPGETVGLVGESGCGKSTLLRCILGLDRPQAGQILLQGQVFNARQTRPTGATEQMALRRIVQIVFQDPYGSFDPRWRVWQLVAEPLHLLASRPAPDEARRRAVLLLEKVGLTAADADRYPHQFSGGQRQRIAIARALIAEPALVVLDEAVSALDMSIRAQILALLAALSRELGVSYLFVSHDMSVVRAITDRVYVMAKGRIVESGTTQSLFDQPQHDYTASLVAATPDLERALATRARQAQAAVSA